MSMCVYFFFFLFFLVLVVVVVLDQNPEPYVFWASGLPLSSISGTVRPFHKYFVI